MPDDLNFDEPAEVHWIRGENASADLSWGEASQKFATLREALDFAQGGLPADARGPFVTTASGRVLRGDDIAAAKPDLAPGR
ncbi:hypothetical protein [Enterovirga aerilata]|uniref:Uncharacterized protein n=1 Tax=Enterovirga aerilata TaxID=2730920 RepID=A0A849I4I2_9HYPH|nr:hypothetical protein [Enterovirga sp. DB1703]NNM71040.1 hypothetical protein [Enterovirga sp. DB1703]